MTFDLGLLQRSTVWPWPFHMGWKIILLHYFWRIVELCNTTNGPSRKESFINFCNFWSIFRSVYIKLKCKQTFWNFKNVTVGKYGCLRYGFLGWGIHFCSQNVNILTFLHPLMSTLPNLSQNLTFYFKLSTIQTRSR